ncbi:MAG: hypothetical protein V1701_06565 [Planctomycetota bacterium]
MLKSSKWHIGRLLIIATLVLLWGSVSYLKSEDNVTIDSIKFGELLAGEAITNEDLQDRVVAVEVWGKW